jgi:hypothetical protein
MVLAAAALTTVVATRTVSSAGSVGLAPADWANDLSPIAVAEWNDDRAAHLLATG